MYLSARDPYATLSGSILLSGVNLSSVIFTDSLFNLALAAVHPSRICVSPAFHWHLAIYTNELGRKCISMTWAIDG